LLKIPFDYVKEVTQFQINGEMIFRKKLCFFLYTLLPIGILFVTYIILLTPSRDEGIFRLNPKFELCNVENHETPLLFVVLVIIAPHFFDKRTQIRNTWGNKQFFSKMRIVFVLAMSQNEIINKQIEKESKLHGDILQVDNLIDSYYVCTKKQMIAFKFITKYCSNVKYILKICDDVVVNTPLLLSQFERRMYVQNEMFGLARGPTKPIRDKKSKWYVSEAQFNGTYPRFPVGQ
jgi:hypothetical protein